MTAIWTPSRELITPRKRRKVSDWVRMATGILTSPTGRDTSTTGIPTYDTGGCTCCGPVTCLSGSGGYRVDFTGITPTHCSGQYSSVSSYYGLGTSTSVNQDIPSVLYLSDSRSPTTWGLATPGITGNGVPNIGGAASLGGWYFFSIGSTPIAYGVPLSNIIACASYNTIGTGGTATVNKGVMTYPVSSIPTSVTVSPTGFTSATLYGVDPQCAPLWASTAPAWNGTMTSTITLCAANTSVATNVTYTSSIGTNSFNGYNILSANIYLCGGSTLQFCLVIVAEVNGGGTQPAGNGTWYGFCSTPTGTYTSPFGCGSMTVS